MRPLGGSPIPEVAAVEWVQLGVVTLVAAVVQGVAGFGFTLVAISFFFLILGSLVVVQLVIVINLVICLSLLPPLWGDVDWRLWRPMAAGLPIGVPVGLVVYEIATVPGLTLVIAGVIIAFSVALLIQGRRAPVQGDAGRAGRIWSGATGVVCGVMTTALGMPGPPVALYLTGIGAPKATLRSVSIILFCASYVGALVLQIWRVGVPGSVWVMAGVLVPVAAVGARIGHRLCSRVGERAFRAFVLMLLVGLGLYMLLTARVV